MFEFSNSLITKTLTEPGKNNIELKSCTRICVSEIPFSWKSAIEDNEEETIFDAKIALLSYP